MTASFMLMHETKAVGTKMFDIASIKENIQLLKSYAQQFVSANVSASPKVEAKGHDGASDSDSSSPTKKKESDKSEL